MAPLNILIIGGGIAGPALAYWLSRLPAPHRPTITVVDRTPDLRASGQQIDLRGQGIAVVRLMGLEAAVRARAVDEAGVRFVDVNGREKAIIPVNKTGKGKQALTSEFEIMRGDLVRILYEATKDKAKYVFGVRVESMMQRGEPGRDELVDVSFSDGTSGTYDLVVGADGQNSRTRRTMVDENGDGGSSSSSSRDVDSDPNFRFLGIYFSYFTMPQEPTDVQYATACHLPGGRLLTTRMDNPRTMQAYLAIRADHPLGAKIEASLRLPWSANGNGPSREEALAAQKAVWAEAFRNSGWQSDRLADALLTSPLANDFYAQKIGQVHAPRWSRGRVVLAGDAAHCPSPLTGLGTSLALVGAYVLAGEIGKAAVERSVPGAAMDLDGALQGYESVLRPYVHEGQKIIPGLVKLAYPKTWLGIWCLHFFAWLWTALGINKLQEAFGSDEAGKWRLPEYQVLGVGKGKTD